MKILSCLFLVVFLSSCFGGSDTPNPTLTAFEADSFSVNVPSSWKQLDSKDHPSAKVGNVVAAFSAKQERASYINNFVVLEMKNPLNESSLGLMNGTKAGLKSQLNSFDLLEESEVNFSDNDAGSILVYRAKYSKNTPELVYIQTAKSCGEKNYFLTLSLAETLEDYNKYKALLQSFTCK